MISDVIFREYDIRGIVDQDLTEEAVASIGRAYGSKVKRQGGRCVASGRDGRLHSKRLQDAFVQGILSTGIDVIDVGQCPTPVLYFAIHKLDLDGGVQITGSHNPPEFNGLKMCIGKSAIYGRQIQELRELILGGRLESGKGNLEKYDIIADYLAYLKQDIQLSRELRVVMDCGNGVSALVAPSAFEQAGCQVKSLYCQVDGRFPNHHPDPTVLENLRDLQEMVLRERADLGVAFDGDGDRVGIVDEKGQVIYGDKILLLLARKLLKEHPGASVIGEVKCSHILYEDIERHGGKAIMWKTGHSLIKQKMKETGALLAGEMSGHIFFADRYFGFDDATYAALRFCEMLSESSESLSVMLSDLPETVSTPEIRVECPERLKFEIVDRLRQKFRSEGYEIIDVDGVRIVFSDGWGLIRASNTQPVLVLRFEANNEERLAEIKGLIEHELERVKSEISIED